MAPIKSTTNETKDKVGVDPETSKAIGQNSETSQPQVVETGVIEGPRLESEEATIAHWRVIA